LYGIKKHDRQPRGEDRLKQILGIMCFCTFMIGGQASVVQAGMMQNLLSSIQKQTKPSTHTLSDGGGEVRANLSAKPGERPDEIIVFKSKRIMELRRQGEIVRRYRVALGRNPIGHKLYQGDNRTPEGKYRIDMRNANSQYYKSIRVSYPDSTDSDVALTVGVHPGDWIMIHGIKNAHTPKQLGHPYRDWTNGCIAVTNQEMDEIWNTVDLGTPITIFP
jgi:murein L,D-transpeptidase YafK